MKNLKWQFWLGIVILAILAISSLIKIKVESGADYVVYAKLLSLFIFYNPIVLTAYIIVALILIFFGIKNKIKFI